MSPPEPARRLLPRPRRSGSVLSMPSARSDGSIPVIDLGPWLAGTPGALEPTARTLRSALEQIGFFILVNHGVPQDLIDQTFAEARRFHDQPMSAKLAVRMNEH